MSTLAQANLKGDDADGNGTVSSSPKEYGLIQLRKEVEAMVAREKSRSTGRSSSGTCSIS